MQAVAGPPPPVGAVLPGVTAQLAVAGARTGGPFSRGDPVLLEGALRTVRGLRRSGAGPLAGVRRRRRQGQGLEFLVLQG